MEWLGKMFSVEEAIKQLWNPDDHDPDWTKAKLFTAIENNPEVRAYYGLGKDLAGKYYIADLKKIKLNFSEPVKALLREFITTHENTLPPPRNGMTSVVRQEINNLYKKLDDIGKASKSKKYI